MVARMSPDFASLQPTLVDRFVELGLGTHAEGVHRLTSFERRLGLGTPHWGQFPNHRWDLRADLAGEFRERVRAWAGDEPCRLFPVRTREVRSPVALFDGVRQ